MLKPRIVLALAACAVAAALSAQAPATAQKLDADAEKWVAATLKKMTLDDKVGQLLVSSFGSEFMSTDSREYEALVKSIHEYRIGGFHVFGGTEAVPDVLLDNNYGSVTLGQPFAAGGVVVVGRGATTAVGTEVAWVEPSALRAVTRTRSVLLRSGDESSYVFPVAPLMLEQLPPVRLHRRHWYANVIGSVPVHLPGSAVSVEPTVGVPEIVGGSVFVGFTWAAALPDSGPLSATAPNAASAASDAATPTRTTMRLRCFIWNFPLLTGPPDGGASLGGVRAPLPGRSHGLRLRR